MSVLKFMKEFVVVGPEYCAFDVGVLLIVFPVTLVKNLDRFAGESP